MNGKEDSKNVKIDEIYKLLYPEFCEGKKKQEDINEEITKKYYKDLLEAISQEKIKSFKTLFSVLDELDNVEVKTSYKEYHEELLRNIKRTKQKIKINTEKHLIPEYMKRLFELTTTEKIENYEILKSQVINNVIFANIRGVNLAKLTKEIKSLEERLRIDPEYQIAVIDRIHEAHHLFEEELYCEGICSLEYAEQYLKEEFIQGYSLFIESKKKLINKHVSKHLERAYYSAETREKNAMETELELATQLIKYQEIKPPRGIQAIKNTYYKEQICTGIKQLREEQEKEEPDKKFINAIRNTLKRNAEYLKINGEEDFLKKYKQ